MFELLIIIVFVILAFRNSTVHDDDIANASRKVGDKVGKLWDIAHIGIKQQRYLRAEKALLTILKIDEKNVAAYNRLGILYAKQKEYKDAIDCFEIASSIEPTASSLHNLGLIYYETENYEKASIAFEEALKLEDSLAARHVAYAKVQEKLGNIKAVVNELNKAISLEPNIETYTLLYNTYISHDMIEEAKSIEGKLKRVSKDKKRPRRILRPRRVVM
jgi:tetratricopeptide (TPR) repeat protein